MSLKKSTCKTKFWIEKFNNPFSWKNQRFNFRFSAIFFLCSCVVHVCGCCLLSKKKKTLAAYSLLEVSIFGKSDDNVIHMSPVIITFRFGFHVNHCFIVLFCFTNKASRKKVSTENQYGPLNFVTHENVNRTTKY